MEEKNKNEEIVDQEIVDKEDKEEPKKDSVVSKIGGVVLNALLVLFVVAATFVLTISISAKKDSDGTATIFNTQLRFVQSDSMGACDQTDVSQYKIKSIPVKSCVFVQVIPTDETERAKWLDEIEVGDVLTFKYVYVSKQETITHRVVKKVANETSGYTITLEGDNKASDSGVLQQVIDTSETNSTNYIIGKVVGQSYVLGLVIYALRSTVGLILIIIIPCIIIIGINVVRIIKVCLSDRKDKKDDAIQNQNKEIEELKRQIELLKNSNDNKTEIKENKEGENL